MIYLVTGANRENGIGAEMVRQLRAAGHQVYATARTAAKDFLALDVSDEQSIAALAEKIPALDVLINNAGTIGDGPVSMATLSETFAINAAGPLLLARALLPAIRRGQKKALVHITSKMGSIADNSSGGYYAYRMSKAALNMASMSLARDLRGDGITSVVLHPGWVQTDMGGRGAPITPETSAKGMLAVIDRLTPKDSGRFYDYKGNEIPF